MTNEFEKEFDDHVYEDDYYEKNYEEEELVSDDIEEDKEKTRDIEDDDDYDNEKKIHMSFACEDCDYRWEETIYKRKDDYEDEDEKDYVCPMCGSMSVTQI